MSATEQQLGLPGVRGGLSGTPEARVSMCLDCGAPLPAILMDVARNDVLILTDRPLRFGTQLQMAIYCDLITAISYNRGTVHSCRATSRGWEIGVFLSQTLPLRLTSRAFDDIRGHLRYECDWKAWLLWDGNGVLDPIRIVNYSIGGMRIRMNYCVPAGSEFTLFPSAGNRTEGAVPGKLQWCRQSGDEIYAGCLIYGNRGRELPKMFANLSAVHVSQGSPPSRFLEEDSPDTLLLDLMKEDRFL
jgi:hypothetical protein